MTLWVDSGGLGGLGGLGGGVGIQRLHVCLDWVLYLTGVNRTPCQLGLNVDELSMYFLRRTVYVVRFASEGVL